MDLNVNTNSLEILDESSSGSSFLNDNFLNSSSSDSSLMFSDSDSHSEEEIPTKMARVCNFLEVIAKYTELQFKKHFRLNRSVAEIIISDYSNNNGLPLDRSHSNISPAKEVYIMLWFLANTETYRQIGDRFDVTRSTVHRVLYRIIEWMAAESYRYIKWPTALEMADNQVQFEIKKGLPGVIGAIDGTHIKINAPKNNKEAFYNRKKYYSVLLQGIVNADKKFIDIHCGEPGSMHDSRLLRKSYFYHKINEDRSIIIPGGVILGDSAYPDCSYIVTPFKDYGNLSSKQLKFNYLHSSTRMVVENAFGLLKARFRRLKFFESPNLAFITNCIAVTCVLHNICMSQNDYIEVEYLEDEVDNTNDYAEPQQSNEISARQQMFEHLENQGLLN